MRPLPVIVLVALLWPPWQLLDAQTTEQQVVERRLVLLQDEIKQLQQHLESSHTRQREEQSRLRKLDLAVQDIANHLRALEQQRQQHRQTLYELEQQRDTQLQNLNQRQAILAIQINGSYRLSRQSRIKLALNQDDPARLGRLLGYYEQINRAQAEKIIALKNLLHELQQVHAAIDTELERVERIQSEQAQALQAQQEQRSERQQLLTRLALQINSEELALVELQRNQKDLETLLQKLTSVLADIPADLGQHLGVAEQKGTLPVPLQGRVLHGFGQTRAAGMNWQGWVVEATPGMEVNSIAYGRVAFADWLRGYGLLIIIDHGQGFLSLYGYNESLLWEVGDWIEAGAVIATVGTSPAGERGLYFELRKDGRALDPAAWLNRKD